MNRLRLTKYETEIIIIKKHIETRTSYSKLQSNFLISYIKFKKKHTLIIHTFLGLLVILLVISAVVFVPLDGLFCTIEPKHGLTPQACVSRATP